MPRKAGAAAAAKSSAETSAPTEPDLADVSFEQAIAELEQIVDQMEQGEVSLQDSLQAYQRGALLVTHCRQSLDSVAEQVKVLEGGLLKPLPAAVDDDEGMAS